MDIKKVIILSIFVKLLIASFFFHPDIKDIALRVSFLQTDHVLNIYNFLQENPLTKVNAPDFVYPPLTYFFLGSYQFLAQPLLGSEFHNFLFDFSGKTSLYPEIFRYLLILKLPYLIFDLLLGLLLYKMVPFNNKKMVLFFWLLNPLNLYAIYAIGQFDIIPAFFVLYAIFLWGKKSFIYSGINLGIAAAFKSYPLLFIPFFLLSEVSLFQKIKFGFFSLLVYSLTILPYLQYESFQKNVLFSGLSQRVFQFKFEFLGFGVSVFILVYSICILIKLMKKSVPIWVSSLLVLLTTYAVSRFHPQWIVWVTPFLSMFFLPKLSRIVPIVIFTISYFIIFLFYGDKFLTTGLFSPISILFLEIPEFTKILSQNQYVLTTQVIRMIFAISCLMIAWRALKSR